ncbi:MAG: hypothetical protein ACOCU6_00145 [Nanoarchaeota archaeon]
MFSDRGKKADGPSITMTQIIFIVIAMLTFFFGFSFCNTAQAATKETFEGTACKAMITTQEVTDSIFMPSYKNACTTVIKEYSLKDKTEDDVMDLVAQGMAFGWWMTNKGKTTDLWTNEKGVLKASGTSCLAVVKIVFTDTDKLDEDEREKINNITQDDIREYLQETDKNDEYTYHTYIQSSGGPGTYKIRSGIDIDREYYIAIASPSSSRMQDVFGKGVQASSGVIFARTGKLPEDCKVL